MKSLGEATGAADGASSSLGVAGAAAELRRRREVRHEEDDGFDGLAGRQSATRFVGERNRDDLQALLIHVFRALHRVDHVLVRSVQRQEDRAAGVQRFVGLEGVRLVATCVNARQSHRRRQVEDQEHVRTRREVVLAEQVVGRQPRRALIRDHAGVVAIEDHALAAAQCGPDEGVDVLLAIQRQELDLVFRVQAPRCSRLAQQVAPLPVGRFLADGDLPTAMSEGFAQASGERRLARAIDAIDGDQQAPGKCAIHGGHFTRPTPPEAPPLPALVAGPAGSPRPVSRLPFVQVIKPPRDGMGWAVGQRRQLSKAPIIEAILDVQFYGVEKTLKELEPALDAYVAAGQQKRYEHQHEFAATIQIGLPSDPVPTDVSVALASIAVVEPDESRVVVMRDNRISVSRVGGYTDWETLWADLIVAFDRYVERANPAGVRRIAARFINRFVPAPDLKTFADVLERPPQPVLKVGFEGAHVSNFLRRHVVEGIDGGLTANLAIGTVTAEVDEDASRMLPLLVDIDVSKAELYPVDINKLAPDFALLRSAKNALFFGSLTEKCLEQFE